jgi:hypothetical protein
VIYSSDSQLDRYFTKVPSSHYAWLFGKNWGINCHDGEPTLCDELQGELGGTVKRASDEPPRTTTTTKMPPPMSAEDQEIANTAKRWLLESFGQSRDGSFKDVPCLEEDPDMMMFCWVPYINDITYSNGVLYLQMDADWTQQPDGARMVTAQNKVRNLFQRGPGPRLVMDNVRAVQSVDVNGVTRSDASLPG